MDVGGKPSGKIVRLRDRQYAPLASSFTSDVPRCPPFLRPDLPRLKTLSPSFPISNLFVKITTQPRRITLAVVPIGLSTRLGVWLCPLCPWHGSTLGGCYVRPEHRFPEELQEQDSSLDTNQCSQFSRLAYK